MQWIEWRLVWRHSKAAAYEYSCTAQLNDYMSVCHHHELVLTTTVIVNSIAPASAGPSCILVPVATTYRTSTARCQKFFYHDSDCRAEGRYHGRYDPCIIAAAVLMLAPPAPAADPPGGTAVPWQCALRWVVVETRISEE